MNGKAIRIQGWSLVPLRLEFLGINDQVLATSTGFCTESDGNTFLVTAWHCMSGRDPFGEHKPLDKKTGALPRAVRCFFPREKIGVWTRNNFSLCDKDGVPKWVQHPRLGAQVDAAALKITPDADLLPRTVESKGNVEDFGLFPGLDVFILGYPLNLSLGDPLGIWKRASIASEPGIDPLELPFFVVDATTTRGMSGSPVIAHSFGTYVTNQRKVVGIDAMYSQFVGMYSDRLIDSVIDDPSGREAELNAHLGRVWKSTAIFDVVRNGVPPNVTH